MQVVKFHFLKPFQLYFSGQYSLLGAKMNRRVVAVEASLAHVHMLQTAVIKNRYYLPIRKLRWDIMCHVNLSQNVLSLCFSLASLFLTWHICSECTNILLTVNNIHGCWFPNDLQIYLIKATSKNLYSETKIIYAVAHN